MRRILPLFFLFFALQAFSQSYGAEVLNDESYFTVENNELYESYFVAIKINNTRGDEYAKISIPYSAEYPIYDLEAWIEDVNGVKIRKLKNKEIEDKSKIESYNLFEDNYVKIFELKYNVYPYIIKYKYRCKKKEFFVICDWLPLFAEIPTRNAKLVVNTPAGYGTSYYENKINPPVKDNSKSRIILTWQTEEMQSLKPEVNSPSIRELSPRVYVVPLIFNYGVAGSQQDWASFGNWAYNLNKGLDNLPESEVQKVHELISGISDKNLIVKRLYEYLQDNTRYVSVQVGIGGVKPFPAEYVAAKKYGDCKALSNYMKALLKAAGITSCVALISAGNGDNTYKIINNFVSTQFNHVILLVPLGKDSVWLDCTSKINPCGYLGTFTQNRYALIIDENNCKLLKTPALCPSNCYTLCKNSMSIDSTGNALLKSSTICTGIGFDVNSMYSAQLNKDRQKEYLSTIIPYQDFEIKRLNIKSENRDSADIELYYQLILKSNVTQAGDYMFLQLNGPRLPDFENPAKRHFPVRLTYPINYIDTTEVTVSDKYKAKQNQDENIETPYGVIKVKYVLYNNKIEIYRNILLKPGEYSTEEYPDFYRFITKLHEAINKPVSFVKYE
jgi:Domain of Unknown Function with PDB structure (DUF3857)/Domain of Unknown Function with PDB structure (DUF3858)